MGFLLSEQPKYLINHKVMENSYYLLHAIGHILMAMSLTVP